MSIEFYANLLFGQLIFMSIDLGQFILYQFFGSHIHHLDEDFYTQFSKGITE